MPPNKETESKYTATKLDKVVGFSSAEVLGHTATTQRYTLPKQHRKPSKVDLCSADDILLAERGPELSEEAANSQLHQDTENN